MGLDCLPQQCPDESHGHTHEVPDGLTHLEGAHCPFEADNFPIGMLASCCSLRGKVAAYELEALGEDDLAGRMYEDMTCEQARDFASELRVAADRLQLAHASDNPRPKGAGWDGTWDAEKKEWAWQSYSTFAEALSSIRQAARWYEKVASLGFGVDAWY